MVEAEAFMGNLLSLPGKRFSLEERQAGAGKVRTWLLY
jgi:hypothetical protein